jgi:hypothetical protein
MDLSGFRVTKPAENWLTLRRGLFSHVNNEVISNICVTIYFLSNNHDELPSIIAASQSGSRILRTNSAAKGTLQGESK